MSSKFKIHQKGLTFNALCLKCFILKTKYNSRNRIYKIENENTLINYKFIEYRIIPKMSAPLFTEDWSLGDEIKLLGAIEKLGLENWEQISKILNKEKFECKSHYYTFYYKDKDDYLISDNETNIKNKSKDIFKANKEKENNSKIELTKNIGYIPFSENDKLNNSLCKKNNKKEYKYKNIFSVLGYSPKRNEFEIEYKNEAELLLSELEFRDSDSYQIHSMNYKILQNYNNILDEREERKKFVLEKNLFNIKREINFDKKLSNEDKEIYLNLKDNLKYLTKEQFTQMFENNVLQKNLKVLLNQLYMYKNLGCQTYEDIQNLINNQKNIFYNKDNNQNPVEIEKIKKLQNDHIYIVKNEVYKKLCAKKSKMKNFMKSLGK